MLRLYSLNNIDGFRNAARPKKEKLVKSITNEIAPQCNYKIDLIYPQEKASKQFEPLAVLTFPNPQQKYTFEKLFSINRKKNSDFKITSSRAKPDTSIHDAHLPAEADVRKETANFYNTALSKCKNPYEAFTPLN